MIITTEQFKQIVGAGGGLVMDASTLSFTQIKDIVQSANSSKARITLKNISGMTAGQLTEIAALAPNQIVFDLSG